MNDIVIKPYKLIGVRPTSGVCAHCGRECPERVFIVENRATGERATLGTHCAWKATGVRHAQPEPIESADGPIGEIPDWMLGGDAA